MKQTNKLNISLPTFIIGVVIGRFKIDRKEFLKSWVRIPSTPFLKFIKGVFMNYVTLKSVSINIFSVIIKLLGYATFGYLLGKLVKYLFLFL